jgi:hypothetical protein
MSKKMRVMGLMAACMLVAAAVYAGDVWKDKDFQNWDLKDVQKILTESPWSHKIQYGGGGSGAMDSPFTVSGDAGHGGTGSSGGPTETSGRDKTAANGTGAMQGMGPQSNYTITWYSSRTIREAMARKKELEGATPDDARKDLSTEPPNYVVAVLGTNLMAFGKDQADDLKAHSYLMSKTTKEKISPTKVFIQRGPDGRRPTAVFYEFAKTTPAGEPTIAKNEKGVEFFTQAGNTPIKIQFDLSKMSDKQGTDY